GLDTVLPPRNVHCPHNWHVELTFMCLFKLCPNTHINLPFSTTGCMLHIGTLSQEDIWITMIPRPCLDQPEHVNMLIMFFTFVFVYINFQDIDINTGIVLELCTHWIWKSALKKLMIHSTCPKGLFMTDFHA
ncbi:hypothetical protein V8E55_008487, partial [Tylopilus felleus]